ncbi:MAG: carbohydrate kinase family protein, partial [Patescibacteria group bacterium]
MRFRERRTYDVLVVGGVYLDLNLAGELPLNRGSHGDHEVVGAEYGLSIGGSGFIFASVLRHLGLKPLLTAQVGDDLFGTYLQQQAARYRVAVDFLVRHGALTNMSANATGTSNTSLSITAGTANQLLKPVDVLRHLEPRVPHSRALYIGSYMKMPQLAAAYARLARQAQRQGCLVILDHGSIHPRVSSTQLSQLRALLPHVDYYLPNQEELLRISRATSLSAGVRWCQRRTRATVVVKRGNAGVLVATAGGTTRVAAIKIPVVHTIGAGDSFNAGFIAGTLRG